MPNREQHLIRSTENEELALALNRRVGVCVDWAVTMLFYAALHRIDAYLAGKFKDYRRLKDMSRAARYDIPNYSEDKLEIAKSKLDRIKQHLSA